VGAMQVALLGSRAADMRRRPALRARPGLAWPGPALRTSARRARARPVGPSLRQPCTGRSAAPGTSRCGWRERRSCSLGQRAGR
jgi:hypothetical protein